MSRECYICGNGHPDILEEHHIVPRRFGGSDEGANLVDLCPNCHEAVGRMYDRRFYDELGVEKPEPDTREHRCREDGCKSTDTKRLEHEGIIVHVCSYHNHCRMGDTPCKASNLPLKSINSPEVVIYCGTHAFCGREENCYAAPIGVYKTINKAVIETAPNRERFIQFCSEHDPREQEGANDRLHR